jgi:hypothetical protein
LYFKLHLTTLVFFRSTLMISDQNSSFETDENQSIRSTSDSVLIEFYRMLREESLVVITQHLEDLKVS